MTKENLMRIPVLILFFPAALPTLSAQQPPRTQPVTVHSRCVDMSNTYHRVIAVVPIVGTGTKSDPRRPAYVPLPTPGKPAARSGIIAFSFLESDDKEFAGVRLPITARTKKSEGGRRRGGPLSILYREACL
jgi:hypothetical protein